MKCLTLNKVRSVWKQFSLRLAVGLVLGVAGAATTVQGQGLITPVAATAQSFYATDGRNPTRAIDGSGMNPVPVVPGSTCSNTPANAMWLSNNTKATWITFDLGSVQPIGGFRLWNYNELNGTFVGRGVRTAGIYSGTTMLAPPSTYAQGGAAWGTLVENMTFSVANGTTTNPGVNYTFTNPVTTRYLQIWVTDNFGTSDAFTGISEIRFFAPVAILGFGANVAGSSAVISPVSGNAGTVAWTVPYGTNLATLKPTYTLTPGATCPQPNDGVTLPTPDFGAGPVTYAVTQGATTNNYTVTATTAPPPREIVTFNANYPGSNSVIASTGPNTGTVTIVMPYGTPGVIVPNLAPSFTLSAGATCDQVSGAKPTPRLSLGGTVTYTVTGEDGITTKSWAVSVIRSGWRFTAWTGDADSGIGGVQSDYTVAVNNGGTAAAPEAGTTVNGITFAAHATTGTNFTMGGTFAYAGRTSLVTGASAALANSFLYGGAPRTVTLNNLTVGQKYETSFFAFAWDVVTYNRVVTFTSGIDSLTVNQDHYDLNNGIRISYQFVAAATSQAFSISDGPNGTFHLSALANRIAPQPVDTDNDQLADDWEQSKAGNLTDLTGLKTGPGPGPDSGDFDDDGLTDADEYALFALYPNINPKVADTDTDGLTDGAEVIPVAPRVASNPTLVDTDGDGLNDFVETNTGNFLNASNSGTNAAVADSDGDYFGDGYEVGLGVSPADGAARPVLPSGVTVTLLTDDTSSGISTTNIYTHKVSGGYAATVNGVVMDVLSDVATPANLLWEVGGGGNKANYGPPPVGGNNYFNWVPATGGVTGAGLLELLQGFTYSDAQAGVTQKFTLSGLTPGMQYEFKFFLRPWDQGGSGRPIDMTFTNGTEVASLWPGHGLLEDRAISVASGASPHAAYAVIFSYLAQSTTLVIDANVPTGAVGNSGGFHMYGFTNRETSPPKPLDFVSVVRAANGAKVTLNISSRPGRVYAVDYSTNLVDWIELTDSVPSAGLVTTYEDTFASNFQRTYYRARDVTP